MRTVYHVTLKDNLIDIFENGLIPKIGELSAKAEEPIERIYLFPNIDDMNTALANWFGEVLEETFGEYVNCCSLKIELPDNFPLSEGEVEYECYSYIPIPPKYISYFRDE